MGRPAHQFKLVGVNNPAFQYVPQASTVDYGPADMDNGLTTETASSGNATMSYDGNHNLTYDGVNTLTYDVENRLIQAENALSCASASPCTYLYDPLPGSTATGLRNKPACFRRRWRRGRISPPNLKNPSASVCDTVSLS